MSLPIDFSYFYIGLAALAIIGVAAILYWPRKKGGKIPLNTRPDTSSRLTILGHKNESKESQPKAETSAQITQAETETEDEAPLFEAVSKDGAINALVLDDFTHSFGERHVQLQPGKDYGRTVWYFDKWLFYLHRLPSGFIEPVPNSPYENLEHSTSETYEACKNSEDIRECFAKRVKGAHQPIMWLIIGGCAALFIFWMMSASGGGG